MYRSLIFSNKHLENQLIDSLNVRGSNSSKSVNIDKDNSKKCSICSKEFSANDLLSINHKEVCCSCKPLYLQSLKESVVDKPSTRSFYWFFFVATLANCFISFLPLFQVKVFCWFAALTLLMLSVPKLFRNDSMNDFEKVLMIFSTVVSSISLLFFTMIIVIRFLL